MSHIDDVVIAARRAVSYGGGPFAAVVIMPSGVHYWGVNRVTLDNDPTAHAEIQAIRAAATREGFDLSGATLYTSCYPCPMCLGAALWARLDRVVWAASSEDAALGGFDDSAFHESFREGEFSPLEVVQEIPTTVNAFDPFEEWAKYSDRIDY